MKTFWNTIAEDVPILLGDAPVPRLCLLNKRELDQWYRTPGRPLRAVAEAFEIGMETDADPGKDLN